MGRNQGFERQQFADTGLPKRGNRSQFVCKHCLAAYSDPTRTNAPPEPKVIAARDTNYTSHLKRCKYYQEAVDRGDVTPPQVQTNLKHFLKQSATNSAPSSAPSSAPMFGQRSASRFSEEVSSASSDKRQRGIREYFNNVFSMEEQEEFERLLIQLQADNCLPDRFIEKLSTRRL
ncbi:hypothetical protein PC123_g4515 [Phytophthora cactorum]|nr:hypothetical protein PC120_g8290 [Phytophthora cactorum]KAG4060585.1 hypothetical protein PC123_g4515 [Phytophthora cactorum]